MFNPVGRENTIFEVLQELVQLKLHFILVGGYAVSAYQHRFSVDADLVIKKEDTRKFEEVLLQKGFRKTITKSLNHTYAAEFIRYETQEKPSASIDLLIGGLGSRTTNASFSIERLQQYARPRIIKGLEKEATVLVPDKEVLIALKIHSGRLTDIRDIVALCHNLNLEIIKAFLTVGNKKIIAENIQKVVHSVDQKEFLDSFKGVFQEKKYTIDVAEIRRLKELLNKDVPINSFKKP